MGAWGTGFFEDDTNCDFVADLVEMNASPDSFGIFLKKESKKITWATMKDLK